MIDAAVNVLENQLGSLRYQIDDIHRHIESQSEFLVKLRLEEAECNQRVKEIETSLEILRSFHN